MNLEQTFRSTVGTMRWQIKFVVLAFAVIFGARLYVRSQAILFSAPDISLWGFESGALLIGCAFLGVAYVRTGLDGDRRLPFGRGHSILADGRRRRCLPVRRRRAGADRQAIRRGRDLPVPGARRADGPGRTGRCCCSPIVRDTGFTSSSGVISARRSTIRFASGVCSRSGWRTFRTLSALCGRVGEADFRDVRRPVGQRVDPSTSKAAALRLESSSAPAGRASARRLMRPETVSAGLQREGQSVRSRRQPTRHGPRSCAH